MKLFLLRIIAFFGIAFVLLELSGFVLLKRLSKVEFYKPGFVKVKNGTHYDFILLGSSRALTSLDTKMLNEEFQLSGFNFGMDDSHIATHRLLLEHIYRNKITADTLFLVYEESRSEVSVASSGDYRFLPFIDEDNIESYFASHRAPWQAKVAEPLPFIPVAYYNIELFFPSLFSFVKPNYHYRFDENGDYQYPGKTVGSITEDRVTRPVEFDNTDLRKIAELCRSNGTKLVVILTPSYNSEYHVKGKASDFDIIDLTQTFSHKRYFYDDIHLNIEGKRTLTTVLIDSLRKTK